MNKNGLILWEGYYIDQIKDLALNYRQ